LLSAACLLSAAPTVAAQECVERTNIEAIVDDSGSMGDTDPNELRRTGMELFIRTQNNSTRTLGAVEFGSTAATVFAPGSIGQQATAMINALRSAIAHDNDGTDYNEGFGQAKADNPNADARIFLTDGGHNEGAYQDGHKPGPPTYVVGLGIGEPKTSPAADRLDRIATETGGRYFADVAKVGIQAVFNTISSIVGCRPLPAPIELPEYTRDGQTESRQYGPSDSAMAVSLVLNWEDPANTFRVADVAAVDAQGRSLATLSGESGGPRLASERFTGSNFDSLTVGSVSGQEGLSIDVRGSDVTRPEAPLLQASDLESLAGLNLKTPKAVKIGSWPKGRSGWTVILASKPKKASAKKQATRAAARGLPGVGLLFSSRHSSLRAGYWTAFSGVLSKKGANKRVKSARRAGFADAYVRFVSAAR
jgi:hypothetical protein